MSDDRAPGPLRRLARAWLLGEEEAARPAHSYQLGRWLLLRVVALCYLIAFASLGSQILGLVGREGILPAAQFLDAVRAQTGPARYHLLPTVFWLGASDQALRRCCAVGIGAALGAFVGILQGPLLGLCWALYLSLLGVCRDFLGFQWDVLLLEAGLLGALLAPLRPLRPGAEPLPRLARILLLWLLFRLMFASGCVKLLSGDPTWRDLTALHYHFETQPLPTWIGWWAHQLPGWTKRLSTAAMFAIELAVPFLMFGPRRVRLVSAALLMLLQGTIALTGNYGFFNLLSGALCLLLLDDQLLGRLLPGRLVGRVLVPRPLPPLSWLRGALLLTWALVVVPVGLAQLGGLFYRPGGRPFSPAPVAWLAERVGPLHSVNRYGLFAVMTTTRPEIIIEGSEDGRTWRAYELPHKPGDLRRRPRFVAPHQVRLDWQLWFAALGRAEDNPWFGRLCLRLLQGSRPVRALFAHDPFPARPPRYLRAVLYQYRFTTIGERWRGGAWWRREEAGLYLGPVSLRTEAERQAGP